jgi:hypothetical protein
MDERQGTSRHFSQHGSAPAAGDSLDVYEQETNVLKEVLAHWDDTRVPQAPEEGESIAPEKYDNGTLAKLALEHSAVFLAAQEDIAKALSVGGRHDLEHKLSQAAEAMRPKLSRLDKLSRGVSPLSLAGDSQFLDAFTDLRSVLQPELLDEDTSPEALGEALGERRQDLRTAKYIRKHAPSAPGRRRWYDRLPFMVRLQTAYDRSRGFPWAESAPVASSKVAKRYDREAS